MVALSQAGHNNNQYSELLQALIVEAGQFYKHSLDIVKVVEQLQAYPILTTTLADLYDAVNVCYYKDEAPPDKTDQNRHEVLQNVYLKTTPMYQCEHQPSHMRNLGSRGFGDNLGISSPQVEIFRLSPGI